MNPIEQLANTTWYGDEAVAVVTILCAVVAFIVIMFASKISEEMGPGGVFFVVALAILVAFYGFRVGWW